MLPILFNHASVFPGRSDSPNGARNLVAVDTAPGGWISDYQVALLNVPRPLPLIYTPIEDFRSHWPGESGELNALEFPELSNFFEMIARPALKHNHAKPFKDRVTKWSDQTGDMTIWFERRQVGERMSNGRSIMAHYFARYLKVNEVWELDIAVTNWRPRP